MKRYPQFLSLLAAVVLMAGCSTQLAPVPTATALLNPAEQSLTEVHDGVAVTARIDQLTVQPYQLIDNLSSFHLTIENRTAAPVTLPTEALLLRDGEGRQFRTVTPERVREIVSKDTVYLIPYPYVGYYYLEDQEHGAQLNTMTSSLPYYAEYHPQDIFTRALPAGPVLPGGKIAGVVYFLADPATMANFELLLFRDAQLQGAPLYRFPFARNK